MRTVWGILCFTPIIAGLLMICREVVVHGGWRPLLHVVIATLLVATVACLTILGIYLLGGIAPR